MDSNKIRECSNKYIVQRGCCVGEGQKQNSNAFTFMKSIQSGDLHVYVNQIVKKWQQ